MQVVLRPEQTACLSMNVSGSGGRLGRLEGGAGGCGLQVGLCGLRAIQFAQDLGFQQFFDSCSVFDLGLTGGLGHPV